MLANLFIYLGVFTRAGHAYFWACTESLAPAPGDERPQNELCKIK